MKILKKVFTYENLVVTFAATVGYGLGFLIPSYKGCSFWISLIISLVVGTLLDSFMRVIVNSEKVKNNKNMRFVVAALSYISYFLAWIYGYILTEHDLDYDLFSGIIYVFLIHIIEIVISSIKKKLKNQKKCKNGVFLNKN